MKKEPKVRTLVLEPAGPVGPYKRVRDRATDEIAFGIADDTVYSLVEAVLDGEALYQLMLWVVSPRLPTIVRKIQQTKRASMRPFSVKVVGRPGPKRPKKLSKKLQLADPGKEKWDELTRFLRERPPYEDLQT